MHSQRRCLTTAVFLVAFSFTALGDDPLRGVAEQSQSGSGAQLPNFDLPVEPFDGRAATAVTVPRETQSLPTAAASNDYAAFAAAYAAAKERGEPAAAYADLHALWSYQQENAVGAWYGAEMHDRLARTYPGYASYIADFAIVDSRGATFYPSTETRHFLLEQASRGNTTRRALASPATTGSTTRRAAAATTATARATQSRSTRPRATQPQRSGRKRYTKASVQPKAQPVVMATTAPAPAPSRATLPAAPKAAASRNTATSPRFAAAAMTARPLAANPAADQPTTRGLVLLVLGVAGVGVLTLLMRVPATVEGAAPQGETANSATPANVEPIKERKTAEEQRGARRATGSRG